MTHSPQIDEEKPSFQGFWYLGVHEQLIFHTVHLMINLVILLCSSLLS